MLRYHELGGFQYSPFFLRRLQDQVEAVDGEVEVISHFPLFPPLGAATSPLTSFYIDATLAQIFEHYALYERDKISLGPKIVASALERERVQYADAKHIVCMSHWAAESLVKSYGLEPSKVHVLPGGANLSENAIENVFVPRSVPITPVRLGFVGKDWRRKNLAFLFSVVDILHSRGVAAEIVAIGFDPATAPHHPLMQANGFINKHDEAQRFIRLLQSCHFGCLFSVAEAFGISNIEFLRLGIPVLAWDVGGIRDTVPSGCGILFPREIAPEDVSNAIYCYIRDPERYFELRSQIIARSEEFSWDCAAQKMITIWNGSDVYSCKTCLN
jgi:glycosyltransferase involved in cell wall biosynthesis